MSQTSTVTATDGAELFEHRWPAEGERRGTIIIVHGLAEHVGRYEHVGAAFARAGFETFGRDLRGHGRTGDGLVYVERWSLIIDDVEQAVRDARAQGGPVILLGHSLGGLIVADYAQSDREVPDLYVLSAPALEADVPWIQKAAAKVLKYIVPKLSMPNIIDETSLSRDPSVAKIYFADPLVITRTTIGFGAAALDCQARMSKPLRPFPKPTLVIHGAEDRVVPTASSARLAELPDVERTVFPEFRHESFNEEGGARAIETVLGWIARQLGHEAG